MPETTSAKHPLGSRRRSSEAHRQPKQLTSPACPQMLQGLCEGRKAGTASATGEWGVGYTTNEPPAPKHTHTPPGGSVCPKTPVVKATRTAWHSADTCIPVTTTPGSKQGQFTEINSREPKRSICKGRRWAGARAETTQPAPPVRSSRLRDGDVQAIQHQAEGEMPPEVPEGHVLQMQQRPVKTVPGDS